MRRPGKSTAQPVEGGNPVKRRIQNSLIALVLMTVLGACGSDAPPPGPTPPPPPGGNGGNGGGNLSIQLEAPTPGTPLFQSQNAQAAYQAMAQALVAQGYATITGRTTTQYSVQPGSPAIWTPTGQPQQNPVQQSQSQQGSYGYYGTGYYGNDIEIRITSPIRGARWFRFVPRYSLHGLILESTDQVALFESQSGPTTLLKIPYRGQNPQILAFTIQSLWNGGGVYYGGYYPQQPQQQGYGIQYLVTNEVLTTSLQYPQQYQPYQQQQQYQQPYQDQGGYF